MHPISPKELPVSLQLDGLSLRSLREHHKLYVGYVDKYNQLTTHLAELQARRGPPGDLLSLKTDLVFAWGAIKNHELFFDVLGQAEPTPPEELLEALTADFGGLPQYLLDLRQAAFTSRTWCWTAYDLDNGKLFNYAGADPNGLPVWNAMPIVAVDLYGHAYFYDFGTNRPAYITAVLRNLNWGAIARRYLAARETRAQQTGTMGT